VITDEFRSWIEEIGSAWNGVRRETTEVLAIGSKGCCIEESGAAREQRAGSSPVRASRVNLRFATA
jgi:hypothetical protein